MIRNVEREFMIGIYFSGTGNSKYAAEQFVLEYEDSNHVFSIEDKTVRQQIIEADEIVFAYPVQYSNLPKILRDFVKNNKDIWEGKKIFVIATMGLFSGDGAGVLARLLKKYGAVIIGGLHLKMPDSIADEKALKKNKVKTEILLNEANKKLKKSS